MDNRLFPLFLLYLVIGKQYNYSYAKSLVGHNIRYSKEKEFPFIASIKYKSTTPNPQEDHICSAVLATRKHAITAEHCMVENLNEILFVTGSNTLSKGKTYKIVAWISYNQWATKNNVHLEYYDNDISIITLEHSIKSSKIKPAIFSTTNIKDLYGFEVVTAGWGISNDGNVSDKMETVIMSIIPRKMCIDHVNKCSNAIVTIPRSFICTVAHPFALIGSGESGGPLLNMKYEVIGINIGTCPKSNIEFNPFEVNIHLSINYYTRFINDIITH